uniref:Putative bovine pancreatic trypsin inhibitor n=1 Tax=Rhipicephalus microplus TaxID=6941 RepID=A0A6G5ABQ8_RHIMP
MKLLHYAVLFCFVISLIMAEDDDEGAGEEDSPDGNETDGNEKPNAEKHSDAPTTPPPKSMPKKESKKGEGGGGEKEEEEEEGGGGGGGGGETNKAKSPTTPELTPAAPPTPSSTSENKGGRKVHKGPRCKIRIPKQTNCKHHSRKWYYDRETDTCVPICGKGHGFLFCTLCMNNCMDHQRTIKKGKKKSGMSATADTLESTLRFNND